MVTEIKMEKISEISYKVSITTLRRFGEFKKRSITFSATRGIVNQPAQPSVPKFPDHRRRKGAVNDAVGCRMQPPRTPNVMSVCQRVT